MIHTSLRSDLIQEPGFTAAVLDTIRETDSVTRREAVAPTLSADAAEGRGEAIASLLGLALEIVPLLPDGQKHDWLNVLLRAPYNPESDFADWLAGHGDLIVDAAIEQANHPQFEVDATNAYAILAMMIGRTAPGSIPARSITLSFANRQRALKMVIGALDPKDDVLARELVRVIRRFPSNEALSMLQEFRRKSQVDPHFTARYGLRTSLQQDVESAISTIQAALPR